MDQRSGSAVSSQRKLARPQHPYPHRLKASRWEVRSQPEEVHYFKPITLMVAAEPFLPRVMKMTAHPPLKDIRAERRGLAPKPTCLTPALPRGRAPLAPAHFGGGC